MDSQNFDSAQNAGTGSNQGSADNSAAVQTTTVAAANTQHIATPPAGQQVAIAVVPGTEYDFDFHRADADFIFSDGNLVILVHGGGEIILQGFGAEAAGHDLPPLNFAGDTVGAFDLLSSTASAEELANIQPAAGPAGGAIPPGPGSFNPFAPAPIGPGIPGEGPIPPTSLAFAPPALVPFVFTNPGEEAPQDFCDRLLNQYLHGSHADVVGELKGITCDSDIANGVANLIVDLVGIVPWQGGTFSETACVQPDLTAPAGDVVDTLFVDGSGNLFEGSGHGEVPGNGEFSNDSIVAGNGSGNTLVGDDIGGTSHTVHPGTADQGNDVIVSGSGNNTLVGDVYAGGSVELNANASGGGQSVSAFNDVLHGEAGGPAVIVGDVYAYGGGGVYLTAQATGSGAYGGNTANAFNDWMQGGAGGGNHLTGDVSATNISGNDGNSGANGSAGSNAAASTGNGSNGGNGGNGYGGGAAAIDLTAAANGTGNHVSAFNDVLIAGGDGNTITGDVSAQHLTGGNGSNGGDGGNGGLAGSDSGVGGNGGNGGAGGDGGDAQVDLIAQAEGNGNQVSAFNDAIVAGGGSSNTLTGDVSAQCFQGGGGSAGGSGGNGGGGSGDDSDDFNVIPGNGGDGGQGGAGGGADVFLGAFAGGDGNTVSAFNDFIQGGAYGGDRITGDVSAQHFTGGDGGNGGDGGDGADVPGSGGGSQTEVTGNGGDGGDGGRGGDGGEAAVSLEAETEGVGNHVSAFNDCIQAAGGGNTITGDVFAQYLTGGDGGDGGNGGDGGQSGSDGGTGGQGGRGGDGGDANVNIFAFAEDQGNSVSAANDHIEVTGGGGNTLVGDVSAKGLSGGDGGDGGNGGNGGSGGSEGHGEDGSSGNGGDGGRGGDAVIGLEAGAEGHANSVSAFNDFIKADGSDNLMVGDVAAQCLTGGNGGDGGSSGSRGGRGGDGGNAGVDLTAQGFGDSNTVSAFNDVIVSTGAYGGNTLIGDVAARDLRGGNGGSGNDGGCNGQNGQGAVNLLAEAGNPGSYGGHNFTFAFNDYLQGAGGAYGGNTLIGDVQISGHGDVNLTAAAYGGTCATTGYGGSGFSGGHNTVVAFNDQMVGGAGGDFMVGDVSRPYGYGDITLSAIAQGEGNLVMAFDDIILGHDGNNTIIGDVSDECSYGDINLSAKAESGEQGGDNTVHAFNDYLRGGADADLIIGDVSKSFSEGEISLSARADGWGCGGNFVFAFNDVLCGEGGGDTLIGDVGTIDSWGKVSLDASVSGDGNFVYAYNDIFHTDPKDTVGSFMVGDVFREQTVSGEQEFNLSLDSIDQRQEGGQDICLSAISECSFYGGVFAFNDLMFGGNGNDIMIGDVYSSVTGEDGHSFCYPGADGGSAASAFGAHIDLTAAAYSGELNTVVAFNDIMNAGNGDNHMVGDVFAQVQGGLGGIGQAASNDGSGGTGGDGGTANGGCISLSAVACGGFLNSVVAFDDFMKAGAGSDTMVGDVEFNVFGGQGGYGGQGGAGSNGSGSQGGTGGTGGRGGNADGGHISLEAKVDSGFSDTVCAYNDSINAGDGDNLVVGDVFAQYVAGNGGGGGDGGQGGQGGSGVGSRDSGGDGGTGGQGGEGGTGGDGGDANGGCIDLTAAVCGFGHSGIGNEVHAFNDLIKSGAGNDLLVGDVYENVAGGDGGHGGDGGLGGNGGTGGADGLEPATGGLASAGYGGDGGEGGEGGEGGRGGSAQGGQVSLSANISGACYGGNHNTVDAFNDTFTGGGGNDTIVGDVYENVAGGRGGDGGNGGQGGGGGNGGYGSETGFAGGQGGNGGNGGDGGDGGDGGSAKGGCIDLTASISGFANGGNFDTVDAFNDVITGGAGNDLMVGDVYSNVQGGNGGNGGNGGYGGAFGYGGAGGYGGNAGNNGGYGGVGNGGSGGNGGDARGGYISLSADISGCWYGGAHDSVSAFNDTFNGGGGNDLMVGDVYSIVAGGNGGNGGAAGGYGGTAGSGDTGGDARGGCIQLSAYIGGGESDTVEAYNDKMTGGAGNDLMVGDVYSIVQGGNGGNGSADSGSGDGGNACGGDIRASAGISSGSGNTVNAYNDNINGGAGNNTLVGDVFALVQGGKGGNNANGGDAKGGNINLYAGIDGGSGNNLNAFNDVLVAAAAGASLIVGDVYALTQGGDGGYGGGNGGSANGGHTDLSAYVGGTGPNTVHAFNDTITAGGAANILVGDVYVVNQDGHDGGGVEPTLAPLGFESDCSSVSLDAKAEGGDNTLNAYNDVINGAGGNDTMVGDAWVTNTHHVNLSAEAYDGGVTNAFNDTYLGGAGKDLLIGDVRVENVDCTDLSAEAEKGGTVFAFNDSLIGGAGADTLIGDVLTDGHGVLNVYAGEGENVHAFNDFLSGNGGNDVMFGDFVSTDGAAFTDYTPNVATGGGEDAFNDTLVGGAGADFIDGQIGNDRLEGDAGNDTFAFNLHDNNDPHVGFSPDNDGNDTITDWDKAHDVLDFSHVIDLVGPSNHDDLVAMINNIDDDGTNTTIHFNNGANLTLNGIVATGLDTSAQLDSLVNNVATQIVVTHT